MSIAEEMLNEEMDRKRNHIALLNAELSRLEAENSHLKTINEVLHEQNRAGEVVARAALGSVKELLEALKLIECSSASKYETYSDAFEQQQDIARAAIQKHGCGA